MTPAGFPHSDIHGSTLESSSPWLFAGFHVLHRLLVPRHPPCALCSLTCLSASRRPGPVNHRQMSRVRGSFRHPRTLLVWFFGSASRLGLARDSPWLTLQSAKIETRVECPLDILSTEIVLLGSVADPRDLLVFSDLPVVLFVYPVERKQSSESGT